MKTIIILVVSSALLISYGISMRAELPGDSDTGIEGIILLSPSHPGPIRQGVSSTAPVAGMEFSVTKEGVEVASFKTDDHGHFRVNVPSGNYTVASKARRNRIGRF